MTDHGKEARDQTLAQFAKHAAELFAAQPALQSAMLAVAQYWNDSADDEVHAVVVASPRATPVWPHECDWTDGDDDGEPGSRPLLAGEACWRCGAGEDIDFYGGYGDSMVTAFEPFCRESAHQSMRDAEAYVPFAIARRAGDRVEVEVIGHAQREPTATIGSTKLAHDWPDARARALFEEVCLHAADDGPRAVLSDYLLEHHPDDPRGEAIALALACALDADARARRDALFAAHAERWMFPLGDVIVAGTAHFERGFLARCNVYAPREADRDRVTSAAAWGTVHTIRFAPGSLDVLAPAMVALRDVGPVRDDGLAAIARAQRPWAIETLHVTADDPDPLLRARTLPRLARLEIPASYRDELVRSLGEAPWRPHLAELVFVWSRDDEPAPDDFAAWRALRAQLDVPALAIATRSWWNPFAAGWELGFRADGRVVVRAGDWHASTTMVGLAELIGDLPADTPIGLVSTQTREMTEVDAAWLRDYTGRPIAVLDK